MSATIEAANATASACAWWWIALAGAVTLGVIKYAPSWIKLWWERRDRTSKAESAKPTVYVEDASYAQKREGWLFVRMSVENNSSYRIKVRRILPDDTHVVFRRSDDLSDTDYRRSWLETEMSLKPREVQDTHWFVGSTLRSMAQAHVSMRLEYLEMSPSNRTIQIPVISNAIDVPHITINKTS